MLPHLPKRWRKKRRVQQIISKKSSGRKAVRKKSAPKTTGGAKKIGIKATAAARRSRPKPAFQKATRQRASKKISTTLTAKILRLLKWILLGCVWGGVLLALVIAWFAWDIPNPSEHLAAVTRTPALQILDNQGQPLSHQGNFQGDFVKAEDLPDHVRHAILATEDRRFYDHIGFDPIGIMRAMIANFRAKGAVQGGSTLTQQVAKNLFLTPQKTLRRKVQELFLALWLEQAFSKSQILTIYINRIYMGAGLYGIDAAAQHYFAVSPQQLSLYQAAVIAGIAKAPSRYNPLVYPQKSAKRANQVLQNMADAGWLAPATARTLFQSQVETAPRALLGDNRRYFTDWVSARVRDLVGYVDTDLIVETTLDPAHQYQAEQAISPYRQRLIAAKADQIAMIAMTPTGAVRAMIGGHDWGKSQFNRATLAKRQPGSTFKPVVYLTALESGLSPESQINDQAISIDGWSPQNASRDYRGVVTLREVVARSLNAATVALSEQIGRQNVIAMARMLGMSGTMRLEPALALGVFETSLLELAQIYASFSHQGRAVEAYGIKRILSRDGKVLYQRLPAEIRQIAKKSTIHKLNQMLHAVIEWGTGKRARIPGLKAAGKTGTTQGFRDAWFAGYHRQLVAVVWVGNDQGTPTKNISGGQYPALIWRDFITAVTADKNRASLPGL